MLNSNFPLTGYYRIQYDENNWAQITNHLLTSVENINAIDPLNRAQLIDDAFTFAKYGQLNYSVALELSTYLNMEKDYIPITAYLDQIRGLNNLLAGSGIYESWKV